MRLAEIKQKINEGRDGWYFKVVQPAVVNGVNLSVGGEVHFDMGRAFYLESNETEAQPLKVKFLELEELEAKGILMPIKHPHLAQVYTTR